jgi:hypothetical protein
MEITIEKIKIILIELHLIHIYLILLESIIISKDLKFSFEFI